MSILIKGVDMPKDCCQCQFRREAYVPWGWIGCQLNAGIGKKKDYKGRHPDCPLVEIPKHGRLIDADALYKQMFSAGLSGKEDRNIAIDAVLQAPTVMGAED